MTADDSFLARGIIAARTGDESTARRILTQVIQEDPRSEAAWLWLSAVLHTPQARAYCLRQVLVLNPRNQTARKGLDALEAAAPAPTIVAQTPPAEALLPAPVAPPSLERWARWRGLASRRDVWQVTVLSLAAIAAVLVGFLLYAVLGSGTSAEQEPGAAIMPSPTPWPRGTLRPTFTCTLTNTPPPPHTFTPTSTSTHTPTPLPTATPTHTATPMPTATAVPTSRPRIRSVSPAEATSRTATPCPAPVIRTLDGRLSLLGVRVEPASVSQNQPYWRLVDAYWTDEGESGGKHSVYIEVLDADGNRALGQKVVVEWRDGSAILVAKDMPPPEYSVNFPMYSTLGSYAVRVLGYPSDRICGLGLGTIEAPDFTIHTCFYLTFQLAYR